MDCQVFWQPNYLNSSLLANLGICNNLPIRLKVQKFPSFFLICKFLKFITTVFPVFNTSIKYSTLMK